jgi:hypothetical protein
LTRCEECRGVGAVTQGCVPSRYDLTAFKRRDRWGCAVTGESMPEDHSATFARRLAHLDDELTANRPNAFRIARGLGNRGPVDSEAESSAPGRKLRATLGQPGGRSEPARLPWALSRCAPRRWLCHGGVAQEGDGPSLRPGSARGRRSAVPRSSRPGRFGRGAAPARCSTRPRARWPVRPGSCGSRRKHHEPEQEGEDSAHQLTGSLQSVGVAQEDDVGDDGHDQERGAPKRARDGRQVLVSPAPAPGRRAGRRRPRCRPTGAPGPPALRAASRRRWRGSSGPGARSATRPRRGTRPA